MAKVILTPAAIEKLSDIKKYISEELDSPIAADNTVGRIFDALERLERFPDSGALLSSVHKNVPQKFAETRFLVCGNYIALYNHEGESVKVLQVYHGSQDYVRYLFDVRNGQPLPTC
jgi:plasmid stabilization system protein ParE